MELQDIENNNSLHNAAYQVGCDGLIGRTAYNLKTQVKFHASSCEKEDGPFFCKKCMSDVILKKCCEKVDHFAHKAPLTPAISKGESDLHYQCKNEICDELIKIFPNGKWETERDIKPNEKRETGLFTPDVSGEINGQRVGIEIQISAYTIKKFIEKLETYAKWNLPVIWIVPLKKELKNSVFRPRLYERYFHSLYGERLYYWWQGQGITLKPVHFGEQKRFIKSSEWREAGGILKTVGGFDKAYLNIKAPIYGRDVALDKDFISILHKEYLPENERLKIPSCHIWKDTLTKWW